MVDYTKGSKKDFEVNSIKRGRVSVFGESVAQNTPEILGDVLAWLPRLGTITPLEWDAFFGDGGDVTNDVLEWHLLLLDIDNLPTIASIRARALWQALQRWRDFGTAGNEAMVTSKAEVDWLNPEAYTFTEFASFTQRLAMAVIGNSQGNTISMDCIGVLTYMETVIQRVFGSDNWTFEDPDHSEFGAEWGDDMSCDASSS